MNPTKLTYLEIETAELCRFSDIAVSSDEMLLLVDTGCRVWIYDSSGRFIKRLDEFAHAAVSALFGPFVETIESGILLSDYQRRLIGIFQGAQLVRRLKPSLPPWRLAFLPPETIIYDSPPSRPAAFTVGMDGTELESFEPRIPESWAACPVIDDNNSLHMAYMFRGELHSFNDRGGLTGVVNFGPARYPQLLETEYEITSPSGTKVEWRRIPEMLWCTDASWFSQHLGVAVLHGCGSKHIPTLWFVNPTSGGIEDCFINDGNAYISVAKNGNGQLILLSRELQAATSHRVLKIQI